MRQFAHLCGTRLIFAIILSVCLFSINTEALDTLELAVQHDPSYPNVLSVSNMNYQVVGGRFIDFSCDVTVREPLTFGTKVRCYAVSVKNYSNPITYKCHFFFSRFFSFPRYW